MAAVRFACSAAVALGLLCSTAQAADLPVLQDGGGITRRDDPGVAARDRTPPTNLRERSYASARASAKKRTVAGELDRMLAAGQIDQATRDRRRAEYDSFRRAVRKFGGSRRTDMAGVLGVVDGIAARGQLTPSRLPALWLTMQRNRQWWNEGPLLASGARVSFEGSELVWQYVPGEGLAIHPLANFGKLNALWRSKLTIDRMQALMDELLALPADRAGGVAWEYYFDFGGGAPPWVSSLAQGTGLQALSRAALKSGRGAELMPLLHRALGIFRTAPPEGVRTPVDGGIHYLQYSFAPGLRILNGFIQSLVGLHDFAVNAADADAQTLFAEGDAAARVEVPTYDTGAWSLYSRGTNTHESDLNYHGVLRDFLASLCDRTGEPVYCDEVDRLNAYLKTSPVVSVVSKQLRGGRQGMLKFKLSKISRVTVRLRRGSTTVLYRSAVLGYGLKSELFQVPRRAGAYSVSIAATDLAGNAASAVGTVRVLKPRKRA
ncbi:MAG: hypothetical protein QOE86_396 [Solirubrobacteraceae bacterium]|jgi:hypothetical protein|nr:hypothetical protein [Solirubrobacteraceae bacterium]